jgi:hypothetical protein
LTVLEAAVGAALTTAAQVQTPQTKAKTNSNGRSIPLMGANSTASGAELQVFFPLLSDDCARFIDFQ